MNDTQQETQTNQKIDKMPSWNVILHNTDIHSYLFVIELLIEVFKKDVETAKKLTTEIDKTGASIVETTHKERAELLMDMVFKYGPDPYMKNCKESLPCTIEPAV